MNTLFDNKIYSIRYSAGHVEIIHKNALQILNISADDFEFACKEFLRLLDYEVTKIEPELKPCPYCAPNRTYLYVEDPQVRKAYFCVTCDGCGMTGPMREDKNEAIDAWNALPRLI